MIQVMSATIQKPGKVLIVSQMNKQHEIMNGKKNLVLPVIMKQIANVEEAIQNNIKKALKNRYFLMCLMAQKLVLNGFLHVEGRIISLDKIERKQYINNMDNTVSKSYIIADTHWEHTKMIEYCDRHPDFGQKIRNQWQGNVSTQNIVYVLGDVTWGTQGQLQTILAGLPGTKVLIRGNHDRSHTNNWFIQAGFAVVLEKAQVSGVILSHFPVDLTEKEIEYGLINIFGHFHNNDPKKWEENLRKRITKYHYLMILEDIDYKPVNLQLARKGKFVKNAKKLLESERG